MASFCYQNSKVLHSRRVGVLKKSEIGHTGISIGETKRKINLPNDLSCRKLH